MFLTVMKRCDPGKLAMTNGHSEGIKSPLTMFLKDITTQNMTNGHSEGIKSPLTMFLKDITTQNAID